MRISAWSSDVCSSDLDAAAPAVAAAAHRRAEQAAALVIADRLDPDPARGGQFADGELHRLTPYHGTDAIWDAMTKQAILHRMVMKDHIRSEEHTSELQSLMRISYAVFCLKKKNTINVNSQTHHMIHYNI